jgi:hypothetical protein
MSEVRADVELAVDRSVKEGTVTRLNADLLALDLLLPLDAQDSGFALVGMALAHWVTEEPSYLHFFELLLRFQ